MSAVAEATWWRSLPDGKPISALGFGASSLWARPSFDDSSAQALLCAMADAGLNYFDTAPLYGTGCGERRLGAFLAERDRDAFVISTKVGHNLIDGRIRRGFDVAEVDRSLRGSLDRLGLQRVDLLFLHGPEAHHLTPTLFDWLAALKRDDTIGFSGVNSFSNRVLERVVESPIDAVMLQLNAADFGNAEVAARLGRAGKLIFAGTAMARASFDPLRFVALDFDRIWYALRLLRRNPGYLRRAKRLHAALSGGGEAPAATAIRYVASHPHVLTGLFGTTRIEHALANVQAGQRPMGEAEWSRLDQALRDIVP